MFIIINSFDKVEFNSNGNHIEKIITYLKKYKKLNIEFTHENQNYVVKSDYNLDEKTFSKFQLFLDSGNTSYKQLEFNHPLVNKIKKIILDWQAKVTK